MKKYKEVDLRKLTNQGLKILKNPRIKETVDALLLKGESAKKISEILEKEHNFKVSYQTVRAYYLKCFKELPKKERERLRSIMVGLLNRSSSDEHKQYIQLNISYVAFLKEVLEKLNIEIARLVELQKVDTTSQNAVAIASLLKLMVDIRTNLEQKISDVVKEKEKIVDYIFTRFLEFLGLKVKEKLIGDSWSELLKNVEELFKSIEEEVLGYRILE